MIHSVHGKAIPYIFQPCKYLYRLFIISVIAYVSNGVLKSFLCTYMYHVYIPFLPILFS